MTVCRSLRPISFETSLYYGRLELVYINWSTILVEIIISNRIVNRIEVHVLKTDLCVKGFANERNPADHTVEVKHLLNVMLGSNTLEYPNTIY